MAKAVESQAASPVNPEADKGPIATAVDEIEAKRLAIDKAKADYAEAVKKHYANLPAEQKMAIWQRYTSAASKDGQTRYIDGSWLDSDKVPSTYDGREYQG